VPHFANLPFALLQRAGLAGALGGHFVKRPLASLHGAANAGAPPAINDKDAAATSRVRMWPIPKPLMGKAMLCRPRYRSTNKAFITFAELSAGCALVTNNTERLP